MTQLPFADYLAARDYTSNSQCELWREDRRLYFDHVVQRIPKSYDSDEMKLGRYFEDLLFGVDVRDKYVVAPAREDDPERTIDRRTKAGKAAWAEFVKSAKGKTIITPLQAIVAVQMVEACAAHPKASPWLRRGEGVDQAILRWQCQTTGLLMQGALDRAFPDQGVIVEIKTDRNPMPGRGLENRWYDRGYHRKLATYRDGWEQVFGRPPTEIILIAVANTPRPRVSVHEYKADSPAILTGQVEYLKVAQEIAEAKRMGEYTYRWERETVTGSVPHWAEREAAHSEGEAIAAGLTGVA